MTVHYKESTPPPIFSFVGIEGRERERGGEQDDKPFFSL